LTEIFLDSSYVVALVNAKDQYHEQAFELARGLGERQFVTTDAVLLEVGNGLARRFKSEAIAVIEEFLHQRRFGLFQWMQLCSRRVSTFTRLIKIKSGD
jgi:predicted nucleic acid-binding protein